MALMGMTRSKVSARRGADGPRVTVYVERFDRLTTVVGRVNGGGVLGTFLGGPRRWTAVTMALSDLERISTARVSVQPRRRRLLVGPV